MRSCVKKQIVIACLLSTLSLQGCGVVTSIRADAAAFDIYNTEITIDEEPVKSPVYKKIKSVAIADLSDEFGSYYPEDNKRLYRAAIMELEVMLKETGKFRVIPRKNFRNKLAALGLDIDVTTDDDEELNISYAKVGKALNAHAVVSFGFEAPNATSISNQAKYMGQMLVNGAMTVTMFTNVDFLRSKTGEVLWSQKNKVAWVTGTQGLKTTKNSVLRKKLRAVLKPIVDQAVETL